MRKTLNDREMRKALEIGGLETIVECDYVPSSKADEAAYQEIDFRDHTWRCLLLAATGRDKMSRKLLESEDVLQRMRAEATVLRVRVLTLDAARNLQNAGYHLERITPMVRGKPTSEHAGRQATSNPEENASRSPRPSNRH